MSRSPSPSRSIGARIGDSPDPIENGLERKAPVSRVECHEHAPQGFLRGQGAAQIADHHVRESIPVQISARDAR